MQKAIDQIHFHYLTDPFYFPDRSFMKLFIAELLVKEKRKLDQINYIFCHDEYLLDINRQYLNHDTYTDIITFELSGKNEPLLADVYISIPRLRENARAFEIPFITELRRVMIHGALHLCGYRDKSKEEKRQMTEMENFYLLRYKVSRETNP